MKVSAIFHSEGTSKNRQQKWSGRSLRLDAPRAISPHQKSNDEMEKIRRRSYFPILGSTTLFLDPLPHYL
jgi:hypothetical protein